MALILGLLPLLGIAADNTPENEASSSQEPAASASTENWQASGLPLVQRFCIECHNDDFQEAEVDLEGFANSTAIASNQQLWERALEMVQFGAMPPDDFDQPTDDERQALVTSIESVLFSAACDLTPKPGKVTVRRLNRAEYDNTVSDLFGMELSVADAFPSDEVGAGFDNNGDVLSIPPMLFEKYMDAAEEISQRVVYDSSSFERYEEERSGDQLISEGERWVGSFYGHYLTEDAFIWTEFESPHEGEHEIVLRGGAGQEGQKVRIGIFDEQGVLRGVCNFEYKGDRGTSDRDSIKLQLPAGKHRLIIAGLQEDAEAKVGETTLAGIDRLTEEAIAAGREGVGKKLDVDRGFPKENVYYAILKVNISGPHEAPRSFYPPSHDRLIVSKPRSKGDDKKSVREAAAECLRPFLRRAFRSPVDDATVDSYAQLAEVVTSRDESYERAMQVVTSAVLVSPRFLFRVELPPEDATGEELGPGGSRPLTNHQLASRLSYFLWSSMPDDELLRLADEGALSNEQTLREQVRRMLQDPKAKALGDNFAAQWLGLRNLGTFEPDPAHFPDFDDELRKAMQQETLLAFNELVEKNQSIVSLLDSQSSFLNERLAKHYGIEGVEGDHFRRVSLEGAGRAGLLMHASILSLTSNPGRTSPVKRGKWILENILGTPPPDPPAGVPELEETSASEEGLTVREQLEAHRANPSCASCHRVMDDLGFGLEHFDATGRYRETADKAAIDASGELPGGRAFDGAMPLVRLLRKTESDAFVRNTAKRLLTFAIGRELVPADRCFIEDITQASASHDHRFVDLATEVVLSTPFRYHTLEEPSK